MTNAHCWLLIMKSDSFTIDRMQRRALMICRLAIAFVWFYHGLVPKLLGPAADELLMDRSLGLDNAAAVQLAYGAGTCEIIFAAVLLLSPDREWPLWLTIAAMGGLLVFAAWSAPILLTAAFNPVSTNACVAALAAVAILLQRSLQIGAAQSEERS
jgi:hypothetical protein